MIVISSLLEQLEPCPGDQREPNLPSHLGKKKFFFVISKSDLKKIIPKISTCELIFPINVTPHFLGLCNLPAGLKGQPFLHVLLVRGVFTKETKQSTRALVHSHLSCKLDLFIREKAKKEKSPILPGGALLAEYFFVSPCPLSPRAFAFLVFICTLLTRHTVVVNLASHDCDKFLKNRK